MEQAAPHVFHSPALIANALQRPSLAATDHIVKLLNPHCLQDGDPILRIMTNLLTVLHDTSQHYHDSESSRLHEKDSLHLTNVQCPAPCKSMVFIVIALVSLLSMKGPQ
ncbi:hypothetical protein K438DRAFT_1997464 [Mycena galopus ATCC 62051]|nr:hypothetical protein K438DRAFT_1997464 [Mycena galopus ATCC 62051]